MPEAKALEIADAADLIVNGYAFSWENGNVRMLSLRTGKAAVIDESGTVLETNMDDLDVELAVKYYLGSPGSEDGRASVRNAPFAGADR